MNRIERRLEIEAQAIEFIRANPDVWNLFVRFACEAADKGHRHLSADLVIGRIRWETSIATSGAGQAAGRDLNINNNFSAYFARRFNRQFPELPGFFRLRGIHGNDLTP